MNSEYEISDFFLVISFLICRNVKKNVILGVFHEKKEETINFIMIF